MRWVILWGGVLFTSTLDCCLVDCFVCGVMEDAKVELGKYESATCIVVDDVNLIGSAMGIARASKNRGVMDALEATREGLTACLSISRMPRIQLLQVVMYSPMPYPGRKSQK